MGIVVQYVLTQCAISKHFKYLIIFTYFWSTENCFFISHISFPRSSEWKNMMYEIGLRKVKIFVSSISSLILCAGNLNKITPFFIFGFQLSKQQNTCCVLKIYIKTKQIAPSSLSEIKFIHLNKYSKFKNRKFCCQVS